MTSATRPPFHGEVVQISSLTKVFGRRTPVTAVRDLTVDVLPGRVTGFLGPNGSGKTTTLRCLVGLVTPTSGTALIGDRHYRDLGYPTRTVGSALEASGFHPGRSGRGHLRVIAAAAAIPDARVDEVLALVGLSDAGGRRVVEYSLGMRQRLALASALLGDPGVLILDEPANGLDPEGIAWLRGFLRALAAEGRTVLVSSHVLSEVQQTVDDVIIISNGELVHAGPLDALGSAGRSRTIARSPDSGRLREHIEAERIDGVEVHDLAEDTVAVAGLTPEQVGRLAFQSQCELHELTVEPSDLETVFLRLTGSGRGDAAQ